MLSAREVRERDDRRVALSIKPTLTPAEEAELAQLERWYDATWRTLPRQIAAARAKLQRLQSFAEHLGVGC